MFRKKVGKATFLLRPKRARSHGGGSTQCCAPYGRLHWATVVAHYVRWPLRGLRKLPLRDIA